jgi:hypothetical protein
VKAAEALARLQRADPRDARWFERLGHAAAAMRTVIAVGCIVVLAGIALGRKDLGARIGTAGSLGIWIGVVGWFVLARARMRIAASHQIAYDGLAFDPIAHLRSSRAFGTRVVAWCAAGVGVLGASLAWDAPIASLLAGLAGFAAVTLGSRFVPLSLAPSGAMGSGPDAGARYHGIPPELPNGLLAQIRCERRARLSTAQVLLVALLLSLGWWAGGPWSPALGTLALVAGLASPLVAALVESAAFARASRHDVRLEGARLVAYAGSERRGVVDLEQPFTHQVLAQVEGEAAYRLDQGAQFLEFASTATEAPWIVRDVLKRDWPPRDRAAWDAS